MPKGYNFLSLALLLANRTSLVAASARSYDVKGFRSRSIKKRTDASNGPLSKHSAKILRVITCHTSVCANVLSLRWQSVSFSLATPEPSAFKVFGSRNARGKMDRKLQTSVGVAHCRMPDGVYECWRVHASIGTTPGRLAGNAAHLNRTFVFRGG